MPPNKRAGADGLAVEPIKLKIRPNESVEVQPRRYIIGEDRDIFSVTYFGTANAGSVRQKPGHPNVLIYEPPTDFAGLATFDVSMSDSEGRTIDATVLVNVANAAPTAPTIRVTTRPGKDVEIKVREHARDADGDTVNLTAVGSASNGHARARLNYPNQIRYTPRSGFIGTDRFPYTVSDGKGGTTSGTVEVSVVNTAPTAPTIRIRVRRNSQIDIRIRQYASDADGDTVSLTRVTSASNGTTQIRRNYPNQVRYTPKRGFTGTDQFTYTISDGKGGVTTGTVLVQVFR